MIAARLLAPSDLRSGLVSAQHYDILIIGAGLSGIGIARRIAHECPGKRLAILERRDRIGGTWDLFRYPGIRSDSDMSSFSYGSRTWTSARVLADGAAIRQYIDDSARDAGVAERIQYGLQVTSADWSTQQSRWHLTARHTSGEVREYSCGYLIGCTGYYSHDSGFRPEFPGEANYKGLLVHPQLWPDALDYQGKKVVVIGSGATAITMVPSMAETAGHVTMLQRSPSYVFSIPSRDKLTAALARVMPGAWAYRIARSRNILLHRAAFIACRSWPRLMRRLLLSRVRKHVGPEIDMRHFTPSYMPWDERLCVVPDADLFKALRNGKASIETDRIKRFTAQGILLASGKEIEADIVVTATGLKLQMLGGMQLSVDGAPRQLGEQMTYKGVLVEDLPNLAWIFGYEPTRFIGLRRFKGKDSSEAPRTAQWRTSLAEANYRTSTLPVQLLRSIL